MLKVRTLHFLVLTALTLAPTTLRAMLLARPEIISFSVNPTNSDIVSINVEDRAHESLNFAALSTNAGNTFNVTTISTEHSLSQTNAAIGQRKYVLADGFLLRTDNDGLTWTNTGARRLIRDQTDAAIKKEQKEFDREFRNRIPLRSKSWTPIFLLFMACHAILIISFRKASHGWFAASASAFQSAALLMIVWLMLTAVHQAFHFLNNGQWPDRFWNTSSEFNPSLKTGIIMNIAAQPLPLVAYLIPMSLLLPATLEAILYRLASPTMRARLQPLIFFTVSVFMLATHVYFAFVGYFAQ